MVMRAPTAPRLVYYAFLAAIALPLVAVLCSPRLRPFLAAVSHDPASFEAERNRLRAATPLWNRAVALYNHSLYALGVSGRPGAAVAGRGGWLFLGDVFDNNFSQAIGRRVLDDREAADWTETVGREIHWLASRGIPSAFVVAPAKWSIYPDRLPWWTRDLKPEHSLDRILARGSALPLIDVRDVLREARNHADTYSALNSHWTDFGALVAWQRIASELPRRIPSIGEIRVPTLKSVYVTDEQNEFAGMLNIDAPNEWTKYELTQPLSGYAIVNADGTTMPQAGGARTDLLDLPRVTRNEHAPNRLRVLALRDSSANSLSPFLQDAFYMTYQVDHRLGAPGTWPNLIGLVEQFHPDVVLWIMTERYLNGPAGDLEYWRAASDYECADEKPWATWPDAGGSLALRRGADGLEDVVDLRGTIAGPAVIRVKLDARDDGELTMQSQHASAAYSRRVNFSKGISELFFKLDQVQRNTMLTFKRSPAQGEITNLEIRSGGCLSSSVSADAGGATTPHATPSVNN